MLFKKRKYPEINYSRCNLSNTHLMEKKENYVDKEVHQSSSQNRSPEIIQTDALLFQSEFMYPINPPTPLEFYWICENQNLTPTNLNKVAESKWVTEVSESPYNVSSNLLLIKLVGALLPIKHFHTYWYTILYHLI